MVGIRMKIIAICSAREEPWIDQPVRHLYTQGVDLVRVSCPDLHTARQARQAGADVLPQHGPFHQAEEMTRLANIGLSADWIVPFDADEFWCGADGQTVRQIFAAVDPDIRTVYAPMYQHLTPELRVAHAKPLPKVAFRPHPNMQLEWGQHSVTDPGMSAVTTLQVRELQYRSWEHFVAKIDKARRLYTESDFPEQYGSHMRRLCLLDDWQLAAEWNQILSQPTVHDPIPGLTPSTD